jgi:hypothetical protein
LFGEVLVTVHRNASLTWHVPEWSRSADTLPRAGLTLLKTALADVVASGETVGFPDGIAGDSISFGLSLVHPIATREGKLIPVKARQAVPVFTIAVAWEKPVELTRNPEIAYPPRSRSMGAIGNVRLAFAVTKEGRVDPATVEEIWPAGLKRPTGDVRDAYEAFRRSVIKARPSARFKPAEIGGCIVNQKVEQTFSFMLDR